MKTVFIKTFGCQMNEYDSGRMAAALENAGYNLSPDEDSAEYIIINTCSVRQHAEDRAMSYAGKYLNSKKVVIAGCMAESMKDSLFKDYPELFAVVGTFNFGNIEDVLAGGPKRAYIGETAEKYGQIKEKVKLRGLVTIMQGCDNFCSYCIVPYVRGRERSRPAVEIINEMAEMAKRGSVELTLLGQNVNSYRDLSEGRNINFPALLREAVKVEGIERIRFMTSHPKDLNAELVDTVAAEPKLCNHFHLPLQSGSDSILKKMNRKYTGDEFIEKVRMIRQKIKGVAITTDILVGFPGETAQDYFDTLNMVKELKFYDAYVFKYSAREGTKAAELEETMPDDEKLARLNEVLATQRKITEELNEKLVGREVKALFYDLSRKNRDVISGTLESGRKVFVHAGPEIIGKIMDVKITGVKGMSLTGKLIRG